MYFNKKLIFGISLGFTALFLSNPKALANDLPVFQPDSIQAVHYNWKNGSPSGLPNDHFKALFNQSNSFNSGDYFIQTVADDEVKVSIDGQTKIDSKNWGSMERALWLGVHSGDHQIKTEYVEAVGDAYVFSDVVPFDSWLAYYYPNKNLSGGPTKAKVLAPVGNLKKLSEDVGFNSPIEGLQADNYSARYTTAKRLPAGDYVIRAKADDGVRVYIDGKLVIDRWTGGNGEEDAVKVSVPDRTGVNTDEKDVHWIEVQHLEMTGASKIDVSIEPFSAAVSNSTWIGEIYPNTSFEGTPVILGGNHSSVSIPNLSFNWKSGSPHRTIPKDSFSARFTKKINLSEDGTYLFETKADDGVRVWVDNKLVIDSWKAIWPNVKNGSVSLSKGEHTIKVEYYEISGDAEVSLTYRKYATVLEQTVENVHFNWGAGSPSKNFPIDHFAALYNQTKNFTDGDYFVQTLADDEVKVSIDGQTKIDSKNWGQIERALWLGVDSGNHQIKTEYVEAVGDAYVFSDVVPFDSWLAYYYPNKNLSGSPTKAKVLAPVGDLKKLYEDVGLKSPIEGVPADNYSARYTTAKRLPAGDYVIRAKADDGVRVYIDGKLVIDRWTSGNGEENAVKVTVQDRTGVNTDEKDVHWIEVQHQEMTGASKIDVSIEPFSSAVSSSNWIGEIYPNTSFEGTPVILGGDHSNVSIPNLNFNWKDGSPYHTIPNDHFSARFTKKINISEDGTYLFETIADDGLKVWVDNNLVIDGGLDQPFQKYRNNATYLQSGEHLVVVEYHEIYGHANLAFDFEKLSTESEKIFYQYGGNIHYNWGINHPNVEIPNDNFRGIFDNVGWYQGGDYFVQTVADDSVRVEINNHEVLKSDSLGQTERALWLNVAKGDYRTVTYYEEKVGDAYIFSDIVPFNSWLAYYYPNKEMSGAPKTAKVLPSSGNLVDNNGFGSPDEGVIPSDNFSAKYTTAKRLKAGEYVIRVKADDGFKVVIDGKVVMDRWTPGSGQEDAIKVSISDRKNVNSNEKDVHWIEVQYLEETGASNIEFKMQAITEVLDTEQWVGFAYPNKDFTGNPVVLGGVGSEHTINELNENWEFGSPSPLIPSDNFSVRYYKNGNFEAGRYRINVNSDDGFRMYVDGELKLDSWKNGVFQMQKTIYLDHGYHEIQVDYFDGTEIAKVIVDIEKQGNEPVYLYTDYKYSLFDMVDIQVGLGAQTDKKYNTFIRSDALEANPWNNPSEGTVLGNGWNVRGGAGTDYWIVGKANDGQRFNIIQTLLVNDWHWYQIKFGKTWVNASPEDVGYYVNPNNFARESASYLQFLKLSESAYLNPKEVNDSILKGKGILDGKASSFIEAGEKNNINEVYLLAHALLETGNGWSDLAQGVWVTEVDGQPVKPKMVYNMYGIGAVDSAALKKGSEYAYQKGWFTPETAIIEGAAFVAKNYIHKGQDTLYKMRWNPVNPGTHQYATDIGWAVKQVSRMHDIYRLISDYSLVYDIPRFK